jgi:hypothetical protein
MVLAAALAALLSIGAHGGPIKALGVPSTQSVPLGVTSANEWVNVTAGASPTRSASVSAFDPSRAFGSFGSAFQVAQPGDVIGVACGGAMTAAYPSQSVGFNAAVDGRQQMVVFAPLSGCSPQVGVWTSLAGDYKPVGWYSANGGGTTGDGAVNVESTAGFSLAKPIIVGDQVFAGGALTCSGATATAFTGCSAGSTRDIYLRGGLGVPVYQDGTLDIHCTYCHFQGINAATVVLDSANANQGNQQQFTDAAIRDSLAVLGAKNVLVRNVLIGPNPSGGAVETRVAPFAGNQTDWDPSGLVFDHVSWSGGNANGCVDPTDKFCHDEAVFLQYVGQGTATLGSGLTITNGTFTGCEQYCVFASSFSNGYSHGSGADQNAPSYVLIQNTFFGPNQCKTGGNGSLNISYPCQQPGAQDNIYLRSDQTAAGAQKNYHDWTIRFDTFAGPGANTVDRAATTTAASMIFSSNYGRANFSCDPRWTYDHNVVTGRACNGTSNLGDQAFTVKDEHGVDLSLTAGAPAIGKGAPDPSSYPSVDHNGIPRPLRSAPDAGASQWDPATLLLGRSIGNITLGATQDTVTSFYGQPHSRLQTQGRTITTYRLHDGELTVTYNGSHVIGIATTTPYYATPAGYGVGSARPANPGKWLPCRNSYIRKTGQTQIITTLKGGKHGTTISAITMLNAAYKPC